MRPYRNFGLGALAAIGLVWVSLTLLLNTTGVPDLCLDGNELAFAEPNPSGEMNLVTTLTDCGSGNSKIEIELLGRNPDPTQFILLEDGSNFSAEVSWISEDEANVFIGGVVDFRTFDGQIAKSEHVVARGADVFFEYQN